MRQRRIIIPRDAYACTFRRQSDIIKEGRGEDDLLRLMRAAKLGSSPAYLAHGSLTRPMANAPRQRMRVYCIYIYRADFSRSH